MKKTEKTAKQQFIERDDERNKKALEFEAKYFQIKKAYEELGLNSRFPFESLPEFESPEAYVNARLKEWEKEQPPIITGLYQDELRIKAEYQQKFVAFIRQLKPEVFEELRNLVPFFENLFGDSSNKFPVLFNWFNHDLYELRRTITTEIYSIMSKTEDSLYPLLRFELNPYPKFNYSYKWGMMYEILHFLYWLFPTPNSEKSGRIQRKTLEILANNLVFTIDREQVDNSIQKAGIEKKNVNDVLNKLKKSEAKKIFDALIKNQEKSYLNYESEKNLFLLLNEIETPMENAFGNLILLQIELLYWAKKHVLEKDWLLMYAYDFIRQFSLTPGLPVSELNIRHFQDRSLVGLPFNMNFEGWIPGNDSKEDYEKKLREKFESDVRNYFQTVGHQLNLEETKKITKPKNTDYESIRWLIAWNEKATISQIAKVFGRAPITIEKAIFQMEKDYKLPKRRGSFGKKKFPEIFQERLTEIKFSIMP